MKRTAGRISALLLVVLLLLSGCAPAADQAAPPAATAEPAVTAEPAAEPVETARTFTDSLGRTVALPREITGVAVSGPLAQVYVFPLCPELMVGFSKAFSADAARYIPEEYMALPELGQLYGGKGTMDLEALLAAAPDVVIDVGETKSNMAEDLDALSEQTGIPFVHIDATVNTAPAAYRLLGELTGKTEKAEQLASWCEETLAELTAVMERVDAEGRRKSIIYCLGDKGLNCLAEGSYHAETVNMMGRNAAVVEDVTPSGAGNEVDMEQLILWDPEVIVFDINSMYPAAAEDPVWRQLTAVKTGEIYEAPYGPYGWLSSPPAVQRYLGMVWLGAILYPDDIGYDLQEKVTEYYRLFYGCELSDSDYAALTANALK